MNRTFLIGTGIIFLLGFIMLIILLSTNTPLTKEQAVNAHGAMELFGILASICLGFGIARR